MALGWNEVKERAVRFSKEWKDAFNEEADAKQFLNEFFNVFGISNRRVATFEAEQINSIELHQVGWHLF